MIKNNEITAEIIADYFLTKETMTPKKLQKIVFYAYAWFIALFNEEENNITNILFDEVPEAWIHGPVFPKLYDKYRDYGWSEIPKLDKSIKFESNQLNEFLETIWYVFGQYSANNLESMTHQEDPWINARERCTLENPEDNKISIKDIFVFYNELSRKRNNFKY